MHLFKLDLVRKTSVQKQDLHTSVGTVKTILYFDRKRRVIATKTLRVYFGCKCQWWTAIRWSLAQIAVIERSRRYAVIQQYNVILTYHYVNKLLIVEAVEMEPSLLFYNKTMISRSEFKYCESGRRNQSKQNNSCLIKCRWRKNALGTCTKNTPWTSNHPRRNLSPFHSTRSLFDSAPNTTETSQWPSDNLSETNRMCGREPLKIRLESKCMGTSTTKEKAVDNQLSRLGTVSFGQSEACPRTLWICEKYITGICVSRGFSIVRGLYCALLEQCRLGDEES